MICTNCNTPNRDTARFCNNCGASLLQLAAQPVESSVQTTEPVASPSTVQTSIQELDTPGVEMPALADEMTAMETQANTLQQFAAVVDPADPAAEPTASV